MLLDWSYMGSKVPLMLQAVPRTLAIVLAATALGFVFGLLLALVRSYKVPVLSQLAAAYISIVRGTPLLVIMYLFYYGLPELCAALNESLHVSFFPEELNKYAVVIFIFAVYISAYMAETWYSALNAVDYGQMEAALAVGMTMPQALYRIFLPQAIVSAIPNFGNLFISTIKQTSLVFMIQIVDIMAVAKIEAGKSYRYLEMYVIVSLVYWALTLIFERLFIYWEQHYAKYKRHHV